MNAKSVLSDLLMENEKSWKDHPEDVPDEVLLAQKLAREKLFDDRNI